MFDSEQFYPCAICRTMVTGPHACSPFAVGKIAFANSLSLPHSLTEEDVRRIVREELAILRAGDR